MVTENFSAENLVRNQVGWFK